MTPVSRPAQKLYTYADYLLWDDDKRYELIHGLRFELFPGPTTKHQIVSGNVYLVFGNYLRGKPCKIFTAPFDVRLPVSFDKTDPEKIHTVVQPDLCVICDPQKIDEKGCLGAPDMIVEILSTSSNANVKKDVEDKFHLYEAAGVTEYWIIHPIEETVTVFVLGKEGTYQGGRIFASGSKLTPTLFNDLEVDLAEVFRED